MATTLIIFGGLPGTGKTTLALELARRVSALYLRIDSIEQAIRDSSVVGRTLDDAGYRVAYSVAEDNLRLGRTVIADSVNPLQLTRDAWAGVATRAGVGAIEVEIICSDLQEHRKRVETRIADIDGLKVLTWQEVVTREYQPWVRDHIVIDTASRSVPERSEIAVRTPAEHPLPPLLLENRLPFGRGWHRGGQLLELCNSHHRFIGRGTENCELVSS